MNGELDGRRLHFIAIGGAGMSGLALVCRALGAEVSGSDRAESPYVDRLRGAGIEPRIGHDAEAVPAGADVVVSTAIAPDNPELARARERGQRVLHRGELLAELCALKRLIAVAGAHGKTTTSGMLAHAMRAAGADPAFVLGGELPGDASEGDTNSIHPVCETPRRKRGDPTANGWKEVMRLECPLSSSPAASPGLSVPIARVSWSRNRPRGWATRTCPPALPCVAPRCPALPRRRPSAKGCVIPSARGRRACPDHHDASK